MEKYFDITEFEILVFYDEKERKIRAIIQLWCKNRTGSANFYNFIRVTYVITCSPSRFFLPFSFPLIFSYYRENVASLDYDSYVPILPRTKTFYVGSRSFREK